MSKTTEIGANRTGLQMAPNMSQEMMELVKQGQGMALGNGEAVHAHRRSYIEESHSLGTVPMPATLKGLAKTGMQKLKGENPEVLVDKLGERLAFERTGVRLYDAFIDKCQTGRFKSISVPLDVLRNFRDEELKHFVLVKKAMEELGADPTAQTPSADSNAVMAQGLIQVLNDPRTNIPQCLQAILMAELADNDGWEMLIKLAEELNLDNMAEGFRQAAIEEGMHLHQVRKWHEQLVIGDIS